MSISNYQFTLNLQKTQSQIAVPVTRGDTARAWLISLADGSTPYTLADGCLAKLEIKRPSGTHLEEFCPIENNRTVRYSFSQNANTAAVEGVHDCALVLYDKNGDIIGSPRFTMIVSDRIVSTDDIHLSDEDFTAADAMLVQEAARQNAEAQRSAAETVRQSKEASRLSAEAERLSAEIIRADAETARKEKEAKRISAEEARSADEKLRTSAESARIDAEDRRTSAESARIDAEDRRASAETQRIAAEVIRADAEAVRQTAEALRASAEKEREKLLDGFKANMPLPDVDTEDNEKFLRVSDGRWAPQSVITIGECAVELSVDEETYVTTVSVRDKNGNVLTSDSVDLPLESMVVGGSEENGIITLTLKNGNAVTFDIGDLVRGLAAQSALDSHTQNENNPHGITPSQIGAATAAEVQAAQAIANGAMTAAENARTIADGKANASHDQSASTITGGGFKEAVWASANGQDPFDFVLRNTMLNAGEVTPEYNGEICWQYE